MNTQIKYTLLILGLLLLAVVLTACQQGQRGIQGLPGTTVPVWTTPATPTDCPTGGMVVQVGPNVTVICNGATGSQGSKGDQGDPGVNPTPIQVVQFCPGVTVYPSAFLEIGLIINGSLYAVYSFANGFLTEIPPGNYTSNAIGSACNFTVNPDLSITH